MMQVLAVDAGALDEQRLSKFKSPKVEKEDDLKYDLGNLLASDIHPIDMAEFRRDPEFLMKLTRDNVQLLYNKLFDLPTEKVEETTLSKLPAPTTPLPRAKPIPKEKKQTKWEKFAEARGIKKKTKRERMVWDESTGKWRPRWGYDRANNNEEQWILPAKPGEDASVDPFLKMKQDKKKRFEKNKLNQTRNIRAATKSDTPLNPIIASAQTPSREKLKSDLESALQVARKSSASLGKFDQKLPDEKKLPVGKRKERDKNMKVLDKLLGKETAVLDVKKATNSFISDEQRESKSKPKKGFKTGGKAGGRKGK